MNESLLKLIGYVNNDTAEFNKFKNNLMIYIHPKTQALIFDCDGTIADSMKIHNEAWNTIAKRYDFHLGPSDLADYNGIPTLQILEMLTTSNDKKKFDLHKMVCEKENLAEQKIDHIIGIQPVVDLIKSYNKKLPMVVISGGMWKNVIKTLNVLGLKNHFEFVITADDDHPKKDTPEAFTLIADKLGVDYDKCHVFEDGKPGLINAVKANMMVTDIRIFYP